MTRRVLSAALAVMLAAGAGLAAGAALAVPAAKPWTLVHRFDDARDLFVVAIDPASLRDRAAYLDAEKSLCRTDECHITFYAAGDAMPGQTADWLAFMAAVKASPNLPLAAYLAETGDDDRDTQFDCARVPQADPMNCLPPPPDAPRIRAAARARGPLGRIGPVAMGMTREVLVAALGGPAAVTIMPPHDKGRTIVRAPATLDGRRYDGAYDLFGDTLSVVLLRWHGALGAADCGAEGGRIAAELAPQFGASDGMVFPYIGRDWFRYDWRFSDGATLELRKDIPQAPDDCTLSLMFLGKDAPSWLRR